MTDYAEQIRREQVAALATIRRVAESLPGFTFVEDGGRINAGVPVLVTPDTPADATPELPGGTL